MHDDTPIIPQGGMPCHPDDLLEHIESCKALAATLHIALLNEHVTVETEDLQVFTRVLWAQLSLALQVLRHRVEEEA